MTTENPSTENAPTPGEAPEAGTSPDVPASTPAEAPSGASPSSGEAPAVSSTPAAEPSGEADQSSAAFPTASDFSWDSWDGTTDALPEPVRDWGKRIYDYRQGWVDTEMKTREADIQRLQEIYNGLIDGQEDPRVKEFSERNEAQLKEIEELKQSFGATQKEYEEYKAAVQKAIDDEAKAIADNFKATHSEIFKDPEKLSLLEELLGEDWDLEAIPEVMALSDTARAVARKARVEGTPDRYALQLAASVVSKPAAPRPGATITSGATGSAPTPHRATAGSGDAKTFDELRNNAVGRALKLAKRR